MIPRIDSAPTISIRVEISEIPAVFSDLNQFKRTKIWGFLLNQSKNKSLDEMTNISQF